jgi:type I restriction enzyme S subunit
MIKQYEKYKTTGFHLIEEIPSHWLLQKIKFITDIYNGDSLNDDYKSQFESDDLSSLAYVSSKDIHVDTSEVQYENGLRIPRDFGKFKIAKANSSLLCIEGGSAGRKLAFTNQDVYFVNKLACFQTYKKETSKFLYYSIKANVFQSQFKNSITGMIGGVSISSIKNFYLSIPNLDEQKKITEYLDSQTDIIDELISKKQKLIELLKEKRQAIINEAVTKGLNTNVKMKYSGIVWLGEIPYDWNLRNFETVANKDRYSITGGPFGSDLKNEEYTEEGVRIIQLQNIGVGSFRDDYKIFTSEEKADQLFSCNIYPGDIIVAKMADPVARACVVPDTDKRYIMASDGIRLEVDKFKHNTKFIEYAINSKYFNYQAELNSTGSTRLRIGLNALKKLKFILPNLDQQNLISNYLVSFDDRYIETLNKLEKQISGLNDYRQAIISEAVTGKIDVRDWKSK